MITFLCNKNVDIQQLKIAMKEGEEKMTQVELRELTNEKAKTVKKYAIAKDAGIDRSTLSRFLNNHIDLYPHLFVKLEKYILDNP